MAGLARAAACMGLCLASLGAAGLDAAPLPPGRPAELGSGRTPSLPPPPTTPVPQAAPATPPGPDEACLAGLRAAGAAIETVPYPSGPDPACAIETPVRLTAIADPAENGRPIALPEGPVLACRQAAALVPWLGRIAAPVLKAARGASLKAVRTGPGFQCRGRNRQADGKLSAHGLGLALDIAGFDFADGKTMSVAEEGARAIPDPAFAAIRVAACGWFTTVLGPGSDPYHADHLHLDIQRHGSSDRYRICQ